MTLSVPQEVISFLHAHIDSVEQLEVLLLFKRNPGKTWTADDVNLELRSDLSSIRRRLERLRGNGLLASTGGSVSHYIYAASSEDDRIIAALAVEYDGRRYKIIELIFSRPSNTLKTFADAFRIKKGDDNG